jgi:hypothetical protein
MKMQAELARISAQRAQSALCFENCVRNYTFGDKKYLSLAIKSKHFAKMEEIVRLSFII